MPELDVSLTHAVNALAAQSVVLDALMVGISAAGVPLLVLAVAVQWWRRTERQHTRHVLLAAGASFLIGLALNQAVLLFVHRMRPYDGGVTHLLIARSQDSSFPSDHATAAFAIAATFLLHGRRRLGAGFLAIAALIAFSRVFVGIHYVGDILGGVLTAVIAAVAVRFAFLEGTRADRFITGIL